jgi:hypothetical protein
VYVFYGRSERFLGEVPLDSADATFHVVERVHTFPFGDINGDGPADLVIGPDAYRETPPGFRSLISGRGERWSGPLELLEDASLLADAYVTTGSWLHVPGDLDDDGPNEVLL